MPAITRTEFAKEIGKSGAYVRKLDLQGVFESVKIYPAGKKRWLLDRDPALVAYRQSIDPTFHIIKTGPKGGGDNGGQPDESGSSTGTLYRFKVAREGYKAQREKWLFDVEQGRWIEKAVVSKLIFKILRILRDDIRNIPARQAANIAARSKKKEAEVYQILMIEANKGLEKCGKKILQITEVD